MYLRIYLNIFSGGAQTRWWNIEGLHSMDICRQQANQVTHGGLLETTYVCYNSPSSVTYEYCVMEVFVTQGHKDHSNPGAMQRVGYEDSNGPVWYRYRFKGNLLVLQPADDTAWPMVHTGQWVVILKGFMRYQVSCGALHRHSSFGTSTTEVGAPSGGGEILCGDPFARQ